MMTQRRASRLGFAILLAFFRDRGRFPRHESPLWPFKLFVAALSNGVTGIVIPPRAALAAASQAPHPQCGSPRAGESGVQSRAAAPSGTAPQASRSARNWIALRRLRNSARRRRWKGACFSTLGRPAAVKLGQLFVHALNDDAGFLDRRARREASQTSAMALLLLEGRGIACCLASIAATRFSRCQAGIEFGICIFVLDARAAVADIPQRNTREIATHTRGGTLHPNGSGWGRAATRSQHAFPLV